MSTTDILVVTYGFFGDILFQSAVAERLLEEKRCDHVDFLIGFPQIKPLLDNNPHIRNVYIADRPAVQPAIEFDVSKYAEVIQMGPFSFQRPPVVEACMYAGLNTLIKEYDVFTTPHIDDEYRKEIESVRTQYPNIPIVAVLANWKPKAFEFTKEEYDRGIDVPNKGYGGRLRNIDRIVRKLKERYIVIEVGMPDGVSQYDTAMREYGRTIQEEASLLKYCDFFVGPEGGLANLAAGVGCRTVLDSTFVWQLYGPNGCIRKIQPEPQLGPRFYFNERESGKHVDLSPYLSDDELVEELYRVISNNEIREGYAKT